MLQPDLFSLAKATRKRIAICGDALIDEYVHGTLLPSQDGCPKFVVEDVVRLPGGAANAARSLAHWNAEVCLIAPFPDRSVQWGFDTSLCIPNSLNPVKRRYLDEQGRIVFRQDNEVRGAGMDAEELRCARNLILLHLRDRKWDAVYIADYDKGFLDDETIEQIVALCWKTKIPCVVDPKRSPGPWCGAILKCNHEFAAHHKRELFNRYLRAAVVTNGQLPPALLPGADGTPHACGGEPHVGAGDCFGAHLALALAHGLPLDEAAKVAHAAGRVYVQHLHNRPPWPHEIRKDLDPAGGKVVRTDDLAALRESASPPGRIVFTNGVFRVPHAGHAWLLRWARSQGDVLVVGVNDEESAARQRPGQFVLPLAERLEMLAGLECVDWLVPFSSDDPCEVIMELEPDLLVKGHEYQGETVPGAGLVKEVRFAPAGPYPGHASDLVAAVRGDA